MNKQNPHLLQYYLVLLYSSYFSKTLINSYLNNMKVHYIREFYSNLELGRFQGAQATEMPIHPHVLALKQFYISKHFILSWDQWWGDQPRLQTCPQGEKPLRTFRGKGSLLSAQVTLLQPKTRCTFRGKDSLLSAQTKT